MDFDCVVIGAGPGGLHTGTYLGRFLRKTAVLNGGRPRASWIPETHNSPGFPEGIAGVELLRLVREQCTRYGAEVHDEPALSIEGVDGEFAVRTPTGMLTTRKVVLATGVTDIPPNIPDPERHKGRTIRHCPICDAYEAKGRRMVVIGTGRRVAREAIWLSHYSDEITILTAGDGTEEDIPPDHRELLRELHIKVIASPVTAIEEHGGELGAIYFSDGSILDGVFRGYSAMGLKPNSELATAIGVEIDSSRCINTDQFQRTNIPGVYAVGDIVSNCVAQISVAVGHAAIAATHIHDTMMAI